MSLIYEFFNRMAIVEMTGPGMSLRSRQERRSIHLQICSLYFDDMLTRHIVVIVRAIRKDPLQFLFQLPVVFQENFMLFLLIYRLKTNKTGTERSQSQIQRCLISTKLFQINWIIERISVSLVQKIIEIISG